MNDKKPLFQPALVVAGFLAVNASGATHYVDANGSNPISPYTGWSTAATAIQDAVNASTNGDLVLVTNGTYATGGGRLSIADITNRIVVTNTIMVQSINGPAVTVIQGSQVSSNAARCALVGSGAVLSGFTLTGGESGFGNYSNGGGVYGGGVVSNCVLAGNIAGGGGGADGVTLIDCTLVGNSAEGGGAALSCSLVHCVLTNNLATWAGGTLSCKATNCLIADNSATNYGGGSGYSTLVNCTVAGNSLAPGRGNGGGSYNDTLFNSIIYDNTAPIGSNYVSSGMNYCCAAPSPGGTGNIASDPLFVGLGYGNFHLQSNSPCINGGNNIYVSSTTDLTGNPRIVNGTVDMGAYEYQGNIRYVSLSSTNPIAPYSDWTIAATNIQNAIDAASTGDLVLVTDGVYQVGAELTSDGTSNRVIVTKPLTLESVNGPAATAIAGMYFRQDSIRCAYLTNGVVLAGFTLTNGGTMENGGNVLCADSSVVVSNCVIVGGFAIQSGGGIYGGTLLNCVLANNGCDQYGGGACLGALLNCGLTNNSAARGGGASSNTLINCSLVKNFAQYSGFNSGGGALYCTLSNCVVAGNNSWGNGGGINSSIAIDCAIVSNTASVDGGGAWSGTLNACLVSSNTAPDGGGAYSSSLCNSLVTDNSASLGGGLYGGAASNCTVVLNTASSDGGGIYGGTGAYCYNSIIYFNNAPTGSNSDLVKFNNCCTSPNYPGAGITNDPALMNLAGGDFHLQSTSPCINSGNNTYVQETTDLDGNTRIAGGTVDMGCYEYQTPASVISYAWLQQYGLPTDGSVDHTNLDGTAFNVYQDWIAGLNPTNSASVLAMVPPAAANNNTSGITVRWQSVSGIFYFLQRSTNFPIFTTIQSNLYSPTTIASYKDTSATNGGPYFYRVGVQE